ANRTAESVHEYMPHPVLLPEASLLIATRENQTSWLVPLTLISIDSNGMFNHSNFGIPAGRLWAMDTKTDDGVAFEGNMQVHQFNMGYYPEPFFGDVMQGAKHCVYND